MVPKQDPDKDGFTNEDEWRENTDPNNKESHPPYHTQLFLAKFEQVPFRLVFKVYQVYLIDLAVASPAAVEVQVDTLDLRQPCEFLKLGQTVPNTPFKVEKFEQKFAPGPGGVKQDVSQLTLVHIGTGQRCVLVLDKVADSPDVFANFAYELKQPERWTSAQMIRVKKLQEFVLRPLIDDQHHYKLLDVNEKEARIQLPTGEIYIVKPDPRQATSK